LRFYKIFATAIAIVLLSLFSITCFAAENAGYEITWTYTAENMTDTDLPNVPFWFDEAEYAQSSAYQPDSTFARTIDGGENKITDDFFCVELPAKSAKSVIDIWTFSGGGFDQHLQPNLFAKTPFKNFTYVSAEIELLSNEITKDLTSNEAKVEAIYKWVTKNIKYGELQNFALPEKANCETFASLFHDLLTAAGIPDRKVYGYAIRLIDINGNLTYGESDITDFLLHVWNEYYDEKFCWTFVDATFDRSKIEFEFYGKCPERSPHLAMFYNEIPARYLTNRSNIKWSKTAILRRFEYVDTDAESENLLDITTRIETEASIFSEYAQSTEMPITLNRNAETFSINDTSELYIPPNFRIAIEGNGGLIVSNEIYNINLQFSKNKSFNLNVLS
jgi:hypothetical protein